MSNMSTKDPIESLDKSVQKMQLDPDLKDKSKADFDGYLSKYFEQIPVDANELTLEEIENRLSAPPSRGDRLARINFWRKFDENTYRKCNKIRGLDFYDGVYSRQAFLKSLNLSPYKFAWFLFMPPKYEARLKECLDLGLQKLRDEIITSKLQFPNGHMDPKAAAVFMQAIAFLDNRVNGPLVKKVDVNTNSTTRNLNMNVDLSADSKEPLDVKDLDSKIRAIRAKLDKSAVIDVEEHTTSEAVLPQLPEAKSIPISEILGQDDDDDDPEKILVSASLPNAIEEMQKKQREF